MWTSVDIPDSGSWIKGIGSERGLLTNFGWSMTGGGIPWLKKVIVNGVTVYSTDPNETDAITEINSDSTSNTFGVDGTRYYAEPTYGVYIQNGRVVMKK